MLLLEKRRSERSGRPFLLLLISSDDLQQSSGPALTNSLAKTLCSCIRETDVLGWHQRPRTIGLMMTEIGAPPTAVLDSIFDKISAVLQQSLTAEVYCRLEVVARILPSEGDERVVNLDLAKRNIRTTIDHGLKRAIDVIGSLAAIIALAPVFLTIGVLVKCTSEGPILYSKKRLGKNGREFSFHKFRTMFANNDPEIHRVYVSKLITGAADAKQNDGLYKLSHDPRVTPLGRFLRRTSLDELPQFFNVLLNDMSLVGPRPPLPYEFERYSEWHKRRVMELKPGITGLWQVEGRSRTTFDEMVRMDIRYAKARNVWLDLRIMLQTPAVMLSGRGAR